MTPRRASAAAPAARRASRRCRALVGVVALVLSLVSAGASAQVLAVLSDDSAGYQSVVAELRSGLRDLRAGRLRVDSVTAARAAGIDAATLSGYELIVTVGLSAAQAIVAGAEPGAARPPVLCVLIPRQSYDKLVAPQAEGGDRRVSALFIDQPLSRQLDLLRLALPESRRIGVVVGPSSSGLTDELRAGARRRGLDMSFATVGERAALYPALQALLPQSDLLLLLPDPLAINADTVYGLLLASYRARVPVAGFSEGLLKAGSLFALFSTAQQQGAQSAEIARRVLAHDGPLPAPQYPRDFSVRVNASVARSLGLHVPSEHELQAALEARRGERDAADDAPAAGHGEPP